MRHFLFGKLVAMRDNWQQKLILPYFLFLFPHHSHKLGGLIVGLKFNTCINVKYILLHKIQLFYLCLEVYLLVFLFSYPYFVYFLLLLIVQIIITILFLHLFIVFVPIFVKIVRIFGQRTFKWLSILLSQSWLARLFFSLIVSFQILCFQFFYSDFSNLVHVVTNSLAKIHIFIFYCYCICLQALANGTLLKNCFFVLGISTYNCKWQFASVGKINGLQSEFMPGFLAFRRLFFYKLQVSQVFFPCCELYLHTLHLSLLLNGQINYKAFQ